jgi:DNA invertase Pin-like site-specific DNA recombinase
MLVLVYMLFPVLVPNFVSRKTRQLLGHFYALHTVKLHRRRSKLKTAAVYIRVSTDDQAEYSPDAQLREAKKYAIAHDMIINDEHIYIDEGISGKSIRNRTAFNKMIGTAKMKPKPFDVILLWKFSRFARNREDSIVYKSMLRRQLGIDVVSITENIGDDKMSVLIEAFIEAMDEYYSINLAEEVMKGMTEKALRGQYQAAAPLGYTKFPGQTLQIVEEEAKYIRYIFDQYLAGCSFFAIAGKLNAMGIRTKKGNKIENRTVEYILNNPIYKGYVRWTPTGKTLSSRVYDSPDTIIRKSDHPSIIPEDIFDKASRRLTADRARRSTGTGQQKQRNIISLEF